MQTLVQRSYQFKSSLGRYSPVRRASEGSRNPQVHPFQECQQLQKGLAQQRNNYLVTPSPPAENSVSLPGELLIPNIEYSFDTPHVAYLCK